MDVSIDYAEIENQFAAKVIEKKEAAAGGAEKPKAQGPVQLVDPKVGQNLSIWLSRFKCGMAGVCEGILNLDETLFDMDQLKALIPLLPTKEDFMNIAEYIESGKDVSKLGKAEQFYMEVQKLPHAEQRVKAFIFKLDFPGKKTEVRQDLENLKLAVREVRDSKKFLKVMENILVLGNFINGGTFRANFTGFKIETLTKIQDTKGSDNKTTLMHFLANHLEKKVAAIADFPTELSHVPAGARVSMTQLQADINNLGKALTEVEASMKLFDGEKFGEMLSGFVFVASEDFKNIQKDFTDIETEFKSLVDWFGEDPSKKTPEELFGTLGEFCTHYERARTDNVKARELAEKNQKKEADKEKRRQQTEATKKVSAEKSVVEETVVDDLLSTVRDGDAFRNRRKRVVAI